MIPSKRRDHRRYSNPLGRRTAHGMGLILSAVLAVGPSAGAAEQPQARASAKSKATISDDGGARKKRSARRSARASSEGVAATERRRKRSRREGPGRRAKQAEKGDATGIHLYVSGSYELNLGNDRVVRGEGSTTFQLDRAAAEKLRIGIEQRVHGATPAGKDFLKAVGAMPATLKSTSEILKTLSDPETQKALRQVEELLRLLPQSASQPDAKK